MIISKSKLIFDKPLLIAKEFSFDEYKALFQKPLLGIKKSFGNLEIIKYHKVIGISVDLKVKVTLECSYSLQPFDQDMEINEEVYIGDSLEDDEESIIIEKDEIDIETILLALITSNLPLKPIMPGAKRPQSGDGYRVIDEEQLAKDRSISGDLRFAKLDEIELDDEES